MPIVMTAVLITVIADETGIAAIETTATGTAETVSGSVKESGSESAKTSDGVGSIGAETTIATAGKP